MHTLVSTNFFGLLIVLVTFLLDFDDHGEAKFVSKICLSAS